MVRLSIPVVLLLFLPSCLSATFQRDKRAVAGADAIVAGVVSTAATITQSIADITDNDAAKDAMKYIAKINKIFSCLGPMVSGLSAIVDLAVLLAGKKAPDSAELKFMKEEFPKVHNALSTISTQLESMVAQIDFQTAQINLHRTEVSILVMFGEFNSIMEAPLSDARSDFIRNYEGDHFDRDFFELVNTIKGTFVTSNSVPLFAQYQEHVKCDLRKMEVFSARILQLLSMGLQVKVGYHGFMEKMTDNPAEAIRQNNSISDAQTTVDELMSHFTNVRDDCIDKMADKVKAFSIETMKNPDNDGFTYEMMAKAIQLAIQGKYYMYEFTVVYRTDIVGTIYRWSTGDNFIKFGEPKKYEVLIGYRNANDTEIYGPSRWAMNAIKHYEPNKCPKTTALLKSCDADAKKIVEAFDRCFKNELNAKIALSTMVQWEPYLKPKYKYGFVSGNHRVHTTKFKIVCPKYNLERRFVVVVQ